MTDGLIRKIKWGLAALFLAATPARACDVALLLAVDISGSVDGDEYRIQMDGLAAALADPSVADALVRAKAAVMVMQWTGGSRQDVVVPWMHIADHDDVAALKAATEGAKRQWFNYATAIGAALKFAALQFDDIADCKRKVIDVSGDGRNNEGSDPADMRSTLYRAGITVNGLVIEGSERDLREYYYEHVAVGELAFVMTANGFEDYPDRIRQKLLREVTEQVSDLQDGANSRPSLSFD